MIQYYNSMIQTVNCNLLKWTIGSSDLKRTLILYSQNVEKNLEFVSCGNIF